MVPIEYAITTFVTLALLQAATLLALAGVVLTLRSYTQLVDLVRSVGFKVEAPQLAARRPPTVSSSETEPDT